MLCQAEQWWVRQKGGKILTQLLVGQAGFEPARPCGLRILSPMCLPVPPLPLVRAPGLEPGVIRLEVGGFIQLSYARRGFYI